jgi:hypothetical protein
MKKYAMLSLMVVLAFGACDDDDDDPLGPSNSAEIRVVNASTGVPSVSLLRNGNEILGGVAFQTASSCSNLRRVPTGSQTLQFRATANPATTEDVTFTFAAGQRYTVVLYGPANNLNAVVIPDEPTPVAAGANSNRLRFINAQTTAGDIFATTATGTITGTPTVANLGAGSGTTGATMYQNIATTNVRFRLFNTGVTTGNPRGDYTINTAASFPTSRNATIVFTDAATGQTVTGFQINNCS